MSENKRIRIEREELFKQVWEQSMVQLAKAYGLSDVGLRKICKRLNVPTPPQGYWARKHRKGPPKLSPTDGPTVHVISSIEKPETVEPEYFVPRSKDLIANDRDKKNTIVSLKDYEAHTLLLRRYAKVLRAEAQTISIEYTLIKAVEASVSAKGLYREH